MRDGKATAGRARRRRRRSASRRRSSRCSPGLKDGGIKCRGGRARFARTPERAPDEAGRRVSPACIGRWTRLVHRPRSTLCHHRISHLHSPRRRLCRRPDARLATHPTRRQCSNRSSGTCVYPRHASCAPKVPRLHANCQVPQTFESPPRRTVPRKGRTRPY